MAALLLRACAVAATALTVHSLTAHSVKSSRGDDATSKYYWPHARGHVGRYSATNFTAPANLTAALSWSWHHPEGQYHTIVVSAPLIDHEKNIYIAFEWGVKKFSHSGKQLWEYRPRGPMSYCPSLMDGALFGSTLNGYIFALDMETGRERWALQKASNVPTDTGYVEAHDGVVVAGVDSGPGGGAMRMLGLDASTGSTLWEFRSDQQLWNVMPMFTSDDAWIAMDIRGGVRKHSLHKAELIWRTPAPQRSKDSFSDGGLILGPDGTVYTCSNLEGSGQQGWHGALRAYANSDGRLLWDRYLEYPCNSWPVVSPDGKSVIVPTGAFVGSPTAGETWIQQALHATREQIHNLSMALGDKELAFYHAQDKKAAVQAYDPKTGELQWSTELKPYGRYAARGDEEGYLERDARHTRNQCLPAQFGAPTLSGDGKVYVGRADGLLYAVESGTGSFQTFDALAGFLHPGTSWAPGLMAVTTCDGLFVWEY